MHVLYEKTSRSRFTAIADLARHSVQAPAGDNGIPQVYVELSRKEGAPALFTRTANPKQDTCLVLNDTEPALLEQDFDYLVTRLRSVGIEVHKGPRP